MVNPYPEHPNCSLLGEFLRLQKGSAVRQHMGPGTQLIPWGKHAVELA